MTAPRFDGSTAGPPVGYFTYRVAEDRWTWSDGIYELHGFGPQEVPATTEVMLSHKHPDDRARTYEVFETVVACGEPFSCYHRIIDAQGRVRSVLSVGRGIHDDHGRVEKVVGFFIDLTEVRRVESEADVQAALLRIAEHRAVIDQAKGMVMLATGVDADDAFGVLREYSQRRNIKVSDLSHRLVKAVGTELGPGDESREAVLGFIKGLA
ncbi:MAG TPA: PAS and ANTAR domain-containing protein [Nocardioidaceae bacterium]|jgi:PAS domain S-box-containing protein|nr:PAS and ANTAR domain-containing protein [Nocardioidaceae bacterium]